MSDSLWYKDAVIYEVHVRAFLDSNGDGVGDFPGLTQKLPYLQDLGITCLWLLPFYPSPLRDDGYDIADYTAINPTYGTMDDFRRFVDEAHARNIRVLTELVINHTSDQHPWFQRARRAPKGSPERDYYVWSDSDRKYAGTRIIFVDTETSNWTFDPVAGQYYWHRFFSHQPDLNLENPHVLKAVIDVMRFWLDMGVDALRLDAIPYLVEREGTINENLPETHAVLKHIRRELDRQYSDRVLLAEANQWPSDVRAYFGDGDECHMAFHFPLMPRMFMGLRQEERHPIVEIMNQTPEIPESCQWALFLRNHDELTLEMVTDEERDYMYTQYAADPQMRLNLGIRRRLATLMENSRRRIELMNSLLFTMPGTPVIYYGDEIGMGDNVYLGDRNGVRTPMQWSSDRNAGFSRADPARLYFPVIMDPVYGYEAINVEAQERSPFSLLNWMKRLIGLRRQHPVFGRGSIEFISTPNRKVLTYVRRLGEEIVLCVANLSRTVQPVEIPLTQFAGLTPVEISGQTEFPRIGDQPYMLTLAGYGFYWFTLQHVVVPISPRVAPAIEEREIPTLFAGVVWESMMDGSIRGIVERQALASFVERQRWFGGKARQLESVRFVDWSTLRYGPYSAFLAVIETTYRDGGRERYLLPLAMASGPEAAALEQHDGHVIVARISGARKGVLFDGLYDDGLCKAMLQTVGMEQELITRQGRVRGTRNPDRPWPLDEDAITPVWRRGMDQSNTSVMFGRSVVMKLFRRLEWGDNPDVEIDRHLTEREFTAVPAFAGCLQYVTHERTTADVALVQAYVGNQGSGWHVALEELGRYLERVTVWPAPDIRADAATAWIRSAEAPPAFVQDAIRSYLVTADVLGRRTGELHRELAAGTDVAFAPESLRGVEALALTRVVRASAEEQFRMLTDTVSRLPDAQRLLAQRVLDARVDLLADIDLPLDRPLGVRMRCHGDYHLGQVLMAEDNIVILDFEGEPARPLAERRAKTSPLRDVAGMLRSFSYAALTALAVATDARPEDRERIEPWARLWETWVSAAFMRAYLRATAGAGLLPASSADFNALLHTLIIEKVLYELGYELNNRPDWAHIPLAGLLRLRGSLHA